MRKSKDNLYKRKQALPYLLADSMDINGYLVMSMDHIKKEMTIPFPELNKLPLWDWMRCTNKTRNKLYYLNFSIPYTYVEIDKEVIASNWAFSDYIDHDKNWFKFSTKQDDFIKERKQYYLFNNDWIKTYEVMNQQLEYNKSLDRILVSVNYEKDGFDVVVPESYTGSIKDVFMEALPIMFEGKKGLIPYHITKKYVQEIEGQIFL